MSAERSFNLHLRAGLVAALLLALCQVFIETLVVAVRVRQFLLSPAFFETQMYDFCLKLFSLLPGAASWLRGGWLDRFLPVGFAPKLVVAGGLMVPNLVIAGTLG